MDDKPYAEPVARLVRLGWSEEATFVESKSDYVQMGLTAADVPELIRLACDVDLRDNGKDPGFHGPQHAWWALGQLRAEEAIQPPSSQPGSSSVIWPMASMPAPRPVRRWSRSGSVIRSTGWPASSKCGKPWRRAERKRPQRVPRGEPDRPASGRSQRDDRTGFCEQLGRGGNRRRLERGTVAAGGEGAAATPADREGRAHRAVNRDDG